MATYFQPTDLDIWRVGFFDGVDPDEFNQHDKVAEELDQELRVRFADRDLTTIDVTPLKNAAIYLNLVFVCDENMRSPEDGWAAKRQFYQGKYEAMLRHGLNEIEDTLAQPGGSFVR